MQKGFFKDGFPLNNNNYSRSLTKLYQNVKQMWPRKIEPS